MKSFLLGGLAGAVLTLVVLYAIGLANQNSPENDSVQYLEKPLNYENKEEASFRIFQVLGNAALALEASGKIGDDVMYHGNTVVILGENFYNDQKVTVRNPLRVGTYSYTANGGRYMTVPVIDGEIE